jgi:hypothetical protein
MVRQSVERGCNGPVDDMIAVLIDMDKLRAFSSEVASSFETRPRGRSQSKIMKAVVHRQ